jgi:hypothetical protein
VIDRPTVQRILLVLGIFYASLAFVVIVPFVWKAEFYVDGQRIVATKPELSTHSTSFEAAAWFLGPLLRFLEMLGVDLTTYGSRFDSDAVVTNATFGVLCVASVGLVMLAYRVPERLGWDALVVAGVLVLLSPFAFVISKEVVALVLSAALLVAARGLRWSVTALAVCWIVLLVLLAFYFRAYYLIAAVIIAFSVLVCRRSVTLLAGLYACFFLYLFVGYSTLPIELFSQGRADYLANVTDSRIEYYFDDSSPLFFAVNRAITFVMLNVPVTLPIRSPAYLPFALMQLVVTYRVVRVLWKERGDRMLLLCAHVVLAFTAVSALYEPDYGSYFRHKIGILAFMVLLLCRSSSASDTTDDDPEADSQPAPVPAQRPAGTALRT